MGCTSKVFLFFFSSSKIGPVFVLFVLFCDENEVLPFPVYIINQSSVAVHCFLCIHTPMDASQERSWMILPVLI